MIAVVCLSVLFGERVRADNDWPITLNSAVSNILGGVSEQDKDWIRQTKYEDLIRYHHGWGTGIRNEFGLWRGNNELIISACGKPCHPDSASMRIIEAVWLALQSQASGK